MKILLIDNYDSFTYNLYHYLTALKCKVEVRRNDKIKIDEIDKKKYTKIVISPGPGNPNQAGNCLKIVKYFYKKIPILGVCLGHQIIAQVFGSKIIGAKKLNNLLQDKQRLHNMGQAGLELAKTVFNRNKLYKSFENVLLEASN